MWLQQLRVAPTRQHQFSLRRWPKEYGTLVLRDVSIDAALINLMGGNSFTKSEQSSMYHHSQVLAGSAINPRAIPSKYRTTGPISQPILLYPRPQRRVSSYLCSWKGNPLLMNCGVTFCCNKKKTASKCVDQKGNVMMGPSGNTCQSYCNLLL